MIRNSQKIKDMCLGGILLALALALSFIESLIPAVPFLPSGVKPGLSNIIVMYTLFFLGTGRAFSLAFLKSLFVLLLRGPVGFMMSLSGGFLSLFVILILKKIKGIDLIYISIGGAVFHNVGQIITASLIMKNIYTFYYLPVLIISGVVMGSVTGISLKIIMPHLNKLRGHFK